MEARNELWLLVFFGFGVNYMLRININIAIVEMVKYNSSYDVQTECVECKEFMQQLKKTNTIQSIKANNNSLPVCGKCNQSTNLLERKNITHSVQKKKQCNWDEYQQNLILSSYYWLHWATQIPGGILALHFGPKRVFGLSNFLVGLLTFFVPISVSSDYHMLVILRLAQGLIAGVSWPTMHHMVAKWVPPNERGMFVSSYLGSSAGAAFTYFICGYIIDWYNWEYVFYITGAFSMIWCVFWISLVYDTPEEHPWISKKERNYIQNSLGDSLNKNKLPIPWKSILTSRAVWANLIAQWGANGAVFALLTHTPTFLKYIHGFEMKSTGVWSGLPHLSRWIFALVFGIFTQYQSFMNVTTVRKLATTLCTIGVSIIMLGLVFPKCGKEATVTLLIIAITLQGAIPAGPYANVIDLSPNFSSVLQGIIGMVSVTSGFMYPFIVGYLTQHNQTVVQWQKFFFISASLTFFTGIFYLCFGSSEIQSWNSVRKANKEIQPLHKKGWLVST